MMQNKVLQNFLADLIQNMPKDWLKLTTHRLDIYKEDLAKTEFLEGLNALYENQKTDTESFDNLPTAYDYIRLGHPLSSVLEWALGHLLGYNSENIIAFSSETMPLLAILRENSRQGRATTVWHDGPLPEALNEEVLSSVYNYQVHFKEWKGEFDLRSDKAKTIFYTPKPLFKQGFELPDVDFHICRVDSLGSLILVNTDESASYVKAIQHVRRRESIAMTPADCLSLLKEILSDSNEEPAYVADGDLQNLRHTIANITASKTPAIVASSGLSIQYAIMMGLIDEALERYPNKEIKIVVPPNCYGGTNDQARRVAASLGRVSIMDLPVDGDNDMVQSTELVLAEVAQMDAIAFVIAEIPTNPRVEVPNLEDLRDVLTMERVNGQGETAVKPVFILDQTFCPNVRFLAEDGILNKVQVISYVSGSKFPSGGKCTAGYCVANNPAAHLMPKIAKHLDLCDNGATALQVKTLKEQMPSMLKRIEKAYQNTREFVNFIQSQLPEAKINFVSKELAEQGFTPSVFSLDLPTRGETAEERESYKRRLNQRLIDSMISEIPAESKYCVSYGQLKGCYWTIPATSTQGTTKEEDKDYIARVSVSPELDLQKHKDVFSDFVRSL